jgi:hypothetical protein
MLPGCQSLGYFAGYTDCLRKLTGRAAEQPTQRGPTAVVLGLHASLRHDTILILGPPPLQLTAMFSPQHSLVSDSLDFQHLTLMIKAKVQPRGLSASTPTSVVTLATNRQLSRRSHPRHPAANVQEAESKYAKLSARHGPSNIQEITHRMM